MTCEDAPCCGCCGTNLYGTSPDAPSDASDYYCGDCGACHTGPCKFDDEAYALCRFCGQEIEEDNKGSWADGTDGDGCDGPDEPDSNFQGVHQPE